MKKIVTILIICITIFMFESVYAFDTYELEFKVLNNKKEEKFDLYLLLPTEYIEFAIREANVNLNYEGANTIKENVIPTISVKKENIQNQVYTEKEKEYVQIRLPKEEGNTYVFDVLENYPKMDIKYRIKNIQKDYIVHIDNFKIEQGKCEVEYDYARDIVKQPDKKIIPVGVKILVGILIIIIVVGWIAHVKGKR